MSARKRKKSSRKRKNSRSEEPPVEEADAPPEETEESSAEGMGGRDVFDPFDSEVQLADPEESDPEAEAAANERARDEDEEPAESEPIDVDEGEAPTSEEPESDEAPTGEEPDSAEPADSTAEPGDSTFKEPGTVAPPPLTPGRRALHKPLEAAADKPKVVLMTEQGVESVLRDPVRTTSAVMAVIGGALCLAWLTEMLLLWFPLNLQNAAWTFGTGVRTVELLPSAAVGSALVTYGLLKHPRAPTRIVRGLSTVFATLAGLFLVITFFYLLSLPSTFAQAPSTLTRPLWSTVTQTVLELILSAAACLGVAVVLWRGVKKSTTKGVGRAVPT